MCTGVKKSSCSKKISSGPLHQYNSTHKSTRYNIVSAEKYVNITIFCFPYDFSTLRKTNAATFENVGLNNR